MTVPLPAPSPPGVSRQTCENTFSPFFPGLVPPALNVAITEGMERELIDRLDKLGGKTQNRNPEIIKPFGSAVFRFQ